MYKGGSFILSFVYRPWGKFTVLESGIGFQVKRITVKPNSRLSLQRHKHRDEHWVIVAGTAQVTINNQIFTLNTNESISVKRGSLHRIHNPSQTALLEVIEVQVGEYLGEDDIVRVEDDYGRIQ